MISSNKAEELDDSKRGEEGVKPREFFWDNIVLFVASSIIGLAGVEAVHEFIRGGDVSCFSPTGVELSEAQEGFVNSFCAGYLPQGAYIPAFMIIHAVFITLPHYLWLNHCGGNFDFFFKLASSLKRIREKGEHIQENLVIVGQLESNFCTYGRNKIFSLYVIKLLAQLVVSLAGIGFVSTIFFQRFNSNFTCPSDFNNSIQNPFWPFNMDVVCVFNALKLLQIVWLAEMGLLVLVCFGLLWALVWCFTTHSSELGARAVAQFSFQSGLAPTYYVPSLPISGCCRTGCRWLIHYFISIPRFSHSGPRIQSDLDFLLMKLFRTDNGLGHVFKEVQIEKELKTLAEDDQRRLYIHVSKQKNFISSNSCERENDLKDKERDEQDLMWQFTKKPMKKGVYRDFMTIPNAQQLVLTNTMRGAVLGFGQRAPNNHNAISISFGGVGFATALARVFARVASLNFSPDYNSSDEVASITKYRTPTVSLVMPENILSSQTSDINKFLEKLRAIWVFSGLNNKVNDTSFIVVGPIPREKDFNITTVDLLFEHIYGCLENKAVLLTVHPLEINGKIVKDSFLSYEPNKARFFPLKQPPPIAGSCVREWPARKSALEEPSSETNYRSGAVEVYPKHEMLTSECVLTVQCGSTDVRVQFSAYCYMKDERESRPHLFDISKEILQPLDS